MRIAKVRNCIGDRLEPKPEPHYVTAPVPTPTKCGSDKQN
jgi:hypothetical protein